MELRLIREPSRLGVTLGALYVNGVWQCWTLEDEMREVGGQSVEVWKVHGATAIPAGNYRVVMVPSPRFKRVLPRLLGVPGFDGILIHSGNSIKDTDGCILVGQGRAAAWVSQSKAALDRLLPMLHETTWITIENPRSEFLPVVALSPTRAV